MKNHGIGIVGGGTIVRNGHLPAYRSNDLPVKAIYDQDTAAAESLASEFSIEVETDLTKMLERDDIDIIDIAITPQAQVEIAEQVLRAGRHVLCQKPLAPSYNSAVSLVERCRDVPGVRAVNQQMRFQPIVETTMSHLRDGSIGEVVSAQIFTNMSADFPADHWLAAEPRLMALYGTIHFLDAARHLFGEPQRLTALIRNDPLQSAVGEMWINAWIEWADGPLLVIAERYVNWAGDLEARMRVEGTLGAVRGTFGLWDDYPNPTPPVVEWKSHDATEWTTESSRRTWMPDAFSGPMEALIESIDHGVPHPTSWEDNLSTLRLVEAVYESSSRGRAIELSDFEPDWNEVTQ